MDLFKIRKEIDELKEAETTWQNIEKLAALYQVCECVNDQPSTDKKTQKTIDVMPDCGIGDFEEVCSGKAVYPLMDVLSEHMQVVKLIMPKEYQAVIERIREIPTQ